MKLLLLNPVIFKCSFFFSSDQMNEWGVGLHIAGRLTLLPEDLRKLVAKAMMLTKNNNKLRLNIAYAYTGKIKLFYLYFLPKAVIKCAT